jgi:hypothetical protein
VGAAEGLLRRTASLIPNAPLGLGLPGGPEGRLFPDGVREMREETGWCFAARDEGASRPLPVSTPAAVGVASVVGVVGSSVTRM